MALDLTDVALVSFELDDDPAAIFGVALPAYQPRLL